MIEQQINLLPFKYRKVVIKFSHRKVFAIIGFGVLSIMIIAGTLGYFNLQLRNEIAVRLGEFEEMAQVLAEFKANNTKKVLDDTLVVRVQKYEEMLRQRQQFLKKLNGEDFGNTAGFSEFLLAISRQKFPNIWIESLKIEGKGKGLSIIGKSVSPVDITEYLKSLQSEPAMKGIIFDDLQLSRNPHPKGDFVSFTVSYGTISDGMSKINTDKTFANAGF